MYNFKNDNTVRYSEHIYSIFSFIVYTWHKDMYIFLWRKFQRLRIQAGYFVPVVPAYAVNVNTSIFYMASSGLEYSQSPSALSNFPSFVPPITTTLSLPYKSTLLTLGFTTFTISIILGGLLCRTTLYTCLICMLKRSYMLLSKTIVYMVSCHLHKFIKKIIFKGLSTGIKTLAPNVYQHTPELTYHTFFNFAASSVQSPLVDKLIGVRGVLWFSCRLQLYVSSSKHSLSKFQRWFYCLLVFLNAQSFRQWIIIPDNLHQVSIASCRVGAFSNVRNA